MFVKFRTIQSINLIPTIEENRSAELIGEWWLIFDENLKDQASNLWKRLSGCAGLFRSVLSEQTGFRPSTMMTNASTISTAAGGDVCIC